MLIGILVTVVAISGCQRSPSSTADFLPDAATRAEMRLLREVIEVVVFSDAGLEAAIRDAVGKPTGDIHNTDVAGMTYLDASNRGISDLEGIQQCGDLEWIELRDNEIVDVSALASLTMLKAFDLRNNQIADISVLADMPNIWLLELSDNEIVDVAALVNSKGIGSGDIVCLQGNPVARQPDPQDMSDLEVLQRRGVHIPSAPAVRVSFPDSGLEAAIRATLGKPTGELYDIYLIGLEFLDANSRGIRSLKGISQCPDLVKLLLSGSEIADFTPLLTLPHLEWLDLGDCGSIDVAALSGLTTLTELWLLGNGIVDISALSGLVNLRSLYLDHNEISDISVLSDLTGLWLLGLGDNEISDISVLAALPELEMLILSDNEISDISVLASLKRLKHIYLSHNNVVDISALLGLPDLRTVALEDNQIVDIQVLAGNEGISSLDWVDVRYNNLDLSRGSPTRLNVAALERRGVAVDVVPQN